MMKTEFMDYLDHLQYYRHQHHASLLMAGQQAISDAMTGELERLNRLFYDFPFHYDVMTPAGHKQYCVVSETKRVRWVERFNNLLEDGDFDLVHENGQPIITACPETAARVSQFTADILITACADLLDANGNLNAAIVAFFNLQDLMEHYQADLTALELIALHGVYSYWLEIVSVNLGLQAVKGDCNVLQLEYLNGYAKNLLYKHQTFTPFLRAKIADYLAKYTEIQFAAYLRDLPVERISGSIPFAMNSADDSEDIQS